MLDPIGNSGKSAAVTTASTPGSASARVVSMRRMRACACGLRSILPCTMPGSLRSAGYTAPPLTRSLASTRGSRLPTDWKTPLCSLPMS